MRAAQDPYQISREKATQKCEDPQDGISAAQYFIGLFSRQHNEDDNGGSAELQNIAKHHKNRVDIESFCQANQKNNLSHYRQASLANHHNAYNASNWHVSFWHLLTMLALGVIGVCLYKDWQIEYREQITKLSQKQQNCELQYELNECDDPPPVLKNNCTLYAACRNEKPIPRYTEVLSLVIAKLMKAFLSELGIMVIGVLVVVFAIYMRRPIMNVYYHSSLGDTHGHSYDHYKNALTHTEDRYRIKRD